MILWFAIISFTDEKNYFIKVILDAQLALLSDLK
jgi:hypothetical protein